MDKENIILKPQGEKTETEKKRSKCKAGEVGKPHREMGSCTEICTLFQSQCYKQATKVTTFVKMFSKLRTNVSGMPQSVGRNI